MKALPPAAGLSSLACQSCYQNYMQNVSLAIGLNTLPGFTFWTALEWASACTTAKNQIIGAKASDAKVREKANAIGKLSESIMKRAMQAPVEEQRRQLKEMTLTFERFAYEAGPYMHGVLEGALKSMCIQSWTAIEVLCEDLISETLTSHQAAFSGKTAPRIGMFRKLVLTIDAYKEIFDGDSAILAALTDEGVTSLSKIRHLLVHKAGIVDDKFEGESKALPFLQLFPQIEKDKPLQFDGEIVFTILEQALPQGHRLCMAVDNWIKAKQP